MITKQEAERGLVKFTTEQLHAGYRQILEAKPQLEHYRAARVAILEEIEKRGRAVDRYVAKLKAQLPLEREEVKCQ